MKKEKGKTRGEERKKTRVIFLGPLVLNVVADQSSSSAVCPLVARPHTTAEGIFGMTVAPGEAKNTGRGTEWVMGYRGEALGVGDEGLHGASVGSSPGRQLESLSPPGLWRSTLLPQP
ncbi:unnamed protein product [Pleuronectes platessa]|uniref:Uncharacterized protein n=1 Tax=Pleuronectes platessa TaxID=8262 RepID=A0A9N7U6X1_PLEPL|nr:unnamed protein product [Pleuronectes platessa]